MVTYKADENGYVADIKYEGEAQIHPYNIDTPYYVNKEHKKYETPHNNYPVNTYTSTPKYPDSLYSTTTPTYHKNYQQTRHVQANNNYDQSHHVSYPDTYSTPYNTGYDTHQTRHYPKVNKHYGNLYKDQDNYQVPYVKEHAVTSTKYHTNKPNPHTKYPQTYSTSYPYGKSETKEHNVALTYPPDKYPRAVNYSTVYPIAQDNYQTPYTKDRKRYATPKYSKTYSTTYSNGNYQLSKGTSHISRK